MARPHGERPLIDRRQAAVRRLRELAICRTLALARAAFKAAIAEKAGSPFMIGMRTRVVKRHPEGDW